MMNNNCPICTSQYNKNQEYCNVCSWEVFSIPDTASVGLKNYYNNRVKHHKKLYNELLTHKSSLKRTNTELVSILEFKEKQDKILIKNESEILNLKSTVTGLKSKELLLKDYQERFGEALLGNKSNNSSPVFIKWEVARNQIVLENSTLNKNRIGILICKTQFPRLGKFDTMLLGYVKDNIIEFNTSFLPRGEYYVKPISLNNKANYIFTKPTLSASERDDEKTKIEIK